MTGRAEDVVFIRKKLTIMKLDKDLLDSLTARAKVSPRLRMNFDLRNTPEDGSQRMLNAMEPETVVPVHRHRDTSEVVIVMRGRIRQHVYDGSGKEIECFEVGAGDGFVMEKGVWHRSESLVSGTVIFEAKEGAFAPLAKEDVMEDSID